MTSRKFNEDRASVLDAIRDARSRGATIEAAYKAAGLNVYSYHKYLTLAEREEIKHLNTLRRGRVPRPTFRSITTGDVEHEVPWSLVSDASDLVDSPGRSTLSLAVDRTVTSQQVRLALQECVAVLEQPEEFRARCDKKLAALNDRGFITREQLGRLKFCLEGLAHTMKLIP